MRLLSILAVISVLVMAGCGAGGGLDAAPATSITVPAYPSPAAGQFANPLPIALPDGSLSESCPDPTVIRSQVQGDAAWYMYCTNERFADHATVHLIPISRSEDLVHWTYVTDVFRSMPDWVAPDGGLWAPDIQYMNGRYYLYYAVSATHAGASAIYVATSPSPVGPWSAVSSPVVEPEPFPGGRYRDTIDPAVIQDNGSTYIFFGSFRGGLFARKLSPDGLTSLPSTEVHISPAYRYEAAYVFKHGDYFYLMASAGPCCNGASSGYGVFVGRSENILGPYIDRNGDSFDQPRVGGSVVLAMNGNRWVGPGHNSMLTDASGQDWLIYHAVDVNKPYFAGSWTRRPVMMDRLDWADGWPIVRGGLGPSETPQPAPAAKASDPNLQVVSWAVNDAPGQTLSAFSDEFDSSVFGPQWHWTNATSAFAMVGGQLRIPTSSDDIYFGRNDVPLLTEDAPTGDFMVETRVFTNVPLAGQFNYAQGGIVIGTDDTHYVKLVVVAIDGTRQIEFGRQTGSMAGGSSQYASSLLSAPADETYLRIVRRTQSGVQLYTSYSSHDGQTWERGPTWTASLGSNARISLASMAHSGFYMFFDYVRVSALAN